MIQRLQIFLMPWLSEWQWFRRWMGGKWSRWLINLPLTKNPIWLDGWDRPGCGLWWYECEEWPTNRAAKPNEVQS